MYQHICWWTSPIPPLPYNFVVTKFPGNVFDLLKTENHHCNVLIIARVSDCLRRQGNRLSSLLSEIREPLPSFTLVSICFPYCLVLKS